MSDTNHFRSIGRVLYTQNPFYLISCGFMIYGLQAATHTIGDMFSRGAVLTAGLAAYAILMAATVIAVVRCGRIWEDARSIFLVVIISLVSLSVGLDELCVVNWNAAAGLLAAAAFFCVATIELVLRSCKIRFRAWYRIPLYALLLVYFATPVIAGRMLNIGSMGDRNWSAMVFSIAIAASMLLLIPAVRYGRVWTRGSGTPWTWPCYPLAVFFILVVLAVLRTHAVWMSFSADYLTVSFEPFLLLPIAIALLVLVVESEVRSKLRRRSLAAVLAAPAILLFALSNGGQTYLPTRAELQSVFGSATTISVAALALFYLYTWMRGVRGSNFALITTLFGIGASELPLGIAADRGIQGWMICVAAAVIMFLHCLVSIKSDKRWFALAGLVSATIAVTGIQWDDTNRFLLASATTWMVGSMIIAVFFDTRLAHTVRVCAAVASVCLSAVATSWVLDQPAPESLSLVFVIAGVFALAYCYVVRRTGWLYVAAVQMTCAIAIAIVTGHGNTGWLTFVETYWPIQVGMGSFLAGLSITSLKTGVHRHMGYQLRRHRRRSRFRRGF